MKRQWYRGEAQSENAVAITEAEAIELSRKSRISYNLLDGAEEQALHYFTISEEEYKKGNAGILWFIMQPEGDEGILANSRCLKDITSECQVSGGVLYYKGIPLWRTMYKYNPVAHEGFRIEMNIFQNPGDDDKEISIVGRTPNINQSYDFSTYGIFPNEKKALEWLENPRILY